MFYAALSIQHFVSRGTILAYGTLSGSARRMNGATIMAMRSMMTDQRTITRVDLMVVSVLLAVAVLLIILAQVLGFTLL